MLCNISALGGVWEQIIGAAIYSAVILTLGWLWGRWRTKAEWRSKEFKDRIVLSLNSLKEENGKKKLSLRTLFERDIQMVFQNNTMVDIVKKAVTEAKEDMPVLQIKQEESWYILNAVLNQIAEHFANGTLKKDLGLAVTSKWYTFCLSFEKEGAVRMHKVRVLMLQKDELLNFPESENLILESEKHSTRVKTIRCAKEELQKHPYLFMDVELSA